MFYRIMNDVHSRIVVCCYRGRVGTEISSNSSTIATDNNTVLLKMGDNDTRNM